MKKTLNVNIGNVAFTIDEDAYYTLGGYLDDIRSRLYDSDRQEVMEDIESRTADIFRENLNFNAQVVTLGLVKKAIAIIGSAEDFGEKKYDPTTGNPDGTPVGGRIEGKLYRSRYEKILGGVCGGLARYFGIDVTLVRVIMFLLFCMGSAGFWLYVILWIVVPLEPKMADHGCYRKTKRNRKGGQL
ncbi:MAG: PspC domain-containing protein [Rikenellaceae bacterium]|nr:PspC domain-containing protein [Rikenellaceae bacterium]